MIDKNEILEFLETIIDEDGTNLLKLDKTDNEYHRTAGSVVSLTTLLY